MGTNKIKESKPLIIKPLKDQWISWIVVAYLMFILIFIIGVIVSICTSDIIPWKGIAYFLLIYSAIIFLCALISRIAYRDRIIITESEIIKLHRGKEQFHIKKEDLLFIGIRKVNLFAKLLVIIGALIGDMCTDIVSFRFYKAETVEKRKFGGYLEMCSLTDEEKTSGMNEFVEGITYRQAIKIGKLLNVPIKKVIF